MNGIIAIIISILLSIALSAWKSFVALFFWKNFLITMSPITYVPSFLLVLGFFITISLFRSPNYASLDKEEIDIIGYAIVSDTLVPLFVLISLLLIGFFI